MWKSNVGLAALTGGVIVLGAFAAAPAATSLTQVPSAPPSFLEAGHCYRIAFPIDGAPNYKVLELLGGGWVKAEVDAGSAKAQRQPLWINTAQIVTMREARCSE